MKGIVVYISLLTAFFAMAASEPDEDEPRHGQSFTTSPAEEPVENLIVISDRVISGGVPEGDSAFDRLKSLGVRTIVSVDAARPDVARAEALGMRYVHVPIEYAGISTEQRLSLTRAFRELPGPIYIHCHHGKHRGPAAAALALRSIGEISDAEAESLLIAAGTSPSYPGLWSCVRDAEPLPEDTIGLATAPLPSVAEVRGTAANMARLDRAWSRLKTTKEAGWRAPETHPDLVPATQAGVIADALRVSAEDEEARDLYSPEYFDAMLESWRIAVALEDALVRDDEASAELHYTDLAASCKSCHETYRDARPLDETEEQRIPSPQEQRVTPDLTAP